MGWGEDGLLRLEWGSWRGGRHVEEGGRKAGGTLTAFHPVARLLDCLRRDISPFSTFGGVLWSLAVTETPFRDENLNVQLRDYLTFVLLSRYFPESPKSFQEA